LAGVCVMLVTGPLIMSFRPLKEQIEFECAGAPVLTPEPDPGTPGVPGLPVTSPAKAGLELPPTSTTAKNAAASTDFVCVIGFPL
jgi:hypothetical protein